MGRYGQLFETINYSDHLTDVLWKVIISLLIHQSVESRRVSPLNIVLVSVAHVRLRVIIRLPLYIVDFESVAEFLSLLSSAVTQSMMDETITESSTDTSNHQLFVGSHGLLQLPQSVASALATDFLNKREIRDLGVTCLWMLASLRSCWINEPISLPEALDRLDHQSLRVVDLNSTVDDGQVRTDSIVPRMPHLCIGRFRNVQYHLRRWTMTAADVQLLPEVRQLVDCRKLTLNLAGIRSDEVHGEKLPLTLPITLPPRLQEFCVLEFGRLISIADFVLPSSLVKLEYESQNDPLGCLSKINWPVGPSQLKILNEMCLSPSLTKPLNLPNGLTTISFQHHFFPLTDLTFPMSITDLEVPVWHDENGRYRDLVFPSCLKRLAITVEMGKDDFDLTQWSHLPSSCVNLKLKLTSEFAFHDLKDDDVPLVPAPQSSPPLMIPHFIEQLSITRRSDPLARQWPLPPLDLSSATSLKTLVTDSLERIEWPKGSSASLVSLKPMVPNKEFLATVLPHTLQFLDLRAVNSWNCYTSSSQYQGLLRSLPNLTHLILPIDHRVDLINRDDPAHPMIPAFKEVMSVIFYKYATTVTDSPLITAEPRMTMSKKDMAGYILSCGADGTSVVDERLTAIFTKFALPVGWTNYDQLTVDGFCEFYRDACNDRVQNVWNDLRHHGYRYYLVRDDFIGSLVSFSLLRPGCTVEGRIVMEPDEHLQRHHISPTNKAKVRFDWYRYVNGEQVSHRFMTHVESYQQTAMEDAKFDLNPSEDE